MRNDVQRSGNNGIIPSSFKAISSYLRIVSSGASNVASTVRSAASVFVERENDTTLEQVSWAGFDKLELENGVIRLVLLVSHGSGFQVWDVEEAENVHNIVSRNDGPVSFMQILPEPLVLNQNDDSFAESRPLLVICADGSFSGPNILQDKSVAPFNAQCKGTMNDNYLPTVVWFYSLRSKSYVHQLRFRSVVHLVRCSSKVVAILQSNQIHCFNAVKLEREYTLLTNPVITGVGNIGFGPLALGPRWMAYSGSQVDLSDSGYVSSQQLDSSVSFANSSNGSLVSRYAKEYKKLSKYCSLPMNPNGVNQDLLDSENIGMVIVRDIVSKTVITQFTAHKSPISSLSFDPSGTLLVTASIQGHNINVFRIIPRNSEGSTRSDHGLSYIHLYKLQRGLTNAVIQDISFSADSRWIMISSSRGTSHLFSLSSIMDCSLSSDPSDLGFEAVTDRSGFPVTLSAVSRIRNGNSSWRNTVSGAAAAAAGGGSNISGAISSVFHGCKLGDANTDSSNSMKSHFLLIFSSTGNMIQYALRHFPGARISSEFGLDCDGRLVIEAIRKWSICQKHNRKDREDNTDLYGEIGNSGSSKVYPERKKLENSLLSDAVLTKTKAQERQHFYLSEVELQMHHKKQLWMRSEISFQTMLSEDCNLDKDCVSEGEIEIEKVSISMLEAKSKNLIPLCDYLQSPRYQHERIPVTGHVMDGQFPQYHVSEDSKKPLTGSRSDSLNSITDTIITGYQLENGTIESELLANDTSIDSSTGFVHTNAG